MSTGSSKHLTINRLKARQFLDSGKVDHSGEFTEFGQILKQLNGNLDCWKQNRVDDQAFRCEFEGESSIDVGGPYRETLVHMVDELECGALPLLKKTTNALKNHGIDRNCFILNEESVTPTH